MTLDLSLVSKYFRMTIPFSINVIRDVAKDIYKIFWFFTTCFLELHIFTLLIPF